MNFFGKSRSSEELPPIKPEEVLVDPAERERIEEETERRNSQRSLKDKILGRNEVRPHQVGFDFHYEEAVGENEEWDQALAARAAEKAPQPSQKSDGDKPLVQQKEEKPEKAEREIKNLAEIKENLDILRKLIPFLESVVADVQRIEDSLRGTRLDGVFDLSKALDGMNEQLQEYHKISSVPSLNSLPDKSLKSALMAMSKNEFGYVENLRRNTERYRGGDISGLILVLRADTIAKSPVAETFDPEKDFEKKMFGHDHSLAMQEVLANTAREIRKFYSENFGMNFHELIPLETSFDPQKHTVSGHQTSGSVDGFLESVAILYNKSGPELKGLFWPRVVRAHARSPFGKTIIVGTNLVGFDRADGKVELKSRVATFGRKELQELAGIDLLNWIEDERREYADSSTE